MSNHEDQPVITQQTLAQNEAVENVLKRFKEREIQIPEYQRDADQWDDIKKSLFIESILNRLTVPAFYFAPNEADPQVSDVIDGQQRLTTLKAFHENEFSLSKDDCPYYGNSSHYAGKKYNQLAEVWQRAFRRYNLTLVILPSTVDLALRLEIFRRINEGGTPLSGQDIRLSYYSQPSCVRLIQAVGIFDSSRPGAKRMIEARREKDGPEHAWPWSQFPERQTVWTEWWEDSKGAIGQTASEMFLWHLIGRYRDKVDDLLAYQQALPNRRFRFRGNSEEVLDAVCAQFKHEDLHPDEPRLFPTMAQLQAEAFPQFAKWWFEIRANCGPSANVAKNRSIALLVPALEKVFGAASPSLPQWTIIAKFLKATRDTARTVLLVEFPESKGKWTSQHKQLQAFEKVAEEIARR